MNQPLPLVLASSSVYRKSMLQRTGLIFQTAAPDINEAALEYEEADALVVRLSIAKAQALANDFPKAVIIGSDQVALLNGQILGKPQNHDDAVSQLNNASGQIVTLYTGLAVFNSATGEVHHALDTYEVEYKKLNSQQIENYLRVEKPYDCCGSLKAEGRGIALLNRLSGDDPNTLLGLPIIKLLSLLEMHGINAI